MKSYFALGVIVALNWVGLAAGARAQEPHFSSPSLLPLPDVRTEYPTTQYPAAQYQGAQNSTAPSGSYETGAAAWSNTSGPAFGQRLAQAPAGAPAQGSPETVPTPAAPDNVGPDWASPSDKTTGPYMDAMSAPYGYGGDPSGMEGACGFGSGDACGYGGGMVGGGGAWWASAGGLIMGRDRGNAHFWSFYDSNEAGQFLRQDYGWGGGVQASIGHCFDVGCGCGGGTLGIEAVYWGLYPNTNTQTIFAGQQPGNLNAILNFNSLDYDGLPASNVTNGASAHRLRTGYEIHNVEGNLLNYSLCGGGDCSSRFSHNFGAGVRWFRFRDTLQFAADRTGANFDGAVDELYYDINVTNDLIGFQLIGQSSYWLTNKLSASVGTKFGVYNNHIGHTSHIYGAAGDAVINNGPNAGRAWNVTGSTNTIAFLGELDFGLTYALTSHWSIYGGYRVVGATNVGLTTNQVYHDLRGINDVETIAHNGSLILHGGYAGLQFAW